MRRKKRKRKKKERGKKKKYKKRNIKKEMCIALNNKKAKIEFDEGTSNKIK